MGLLPKSPGNLFPKFRTSAGGPFLHDSTAGPDRSKVQNSRLATGTATDPAFAFGVWIRHYDRCLGFYITLNTNSPDQTVPPNIG